MKKYIGFGERVKGYDLPVLNEREARAGAGILFLFAMISFLNGYLTHRFLFTQIFVTVFMVDFFIRIFINPKFSPSLILGRLFVRHQTPEYVGAVQKRFAWGIGFILSVIMFFIVVVFELMTPVKIAICILCLAFLFSESAFGICIGCTLYHWIYRKSPQYCPGNVCEIKKKEEIQRVSGLQLTVLALSLLIIVGFTHDRMRKTDTLSTTAMQCQSGKCSSNKCGGF
ncbi:DUF4395 domain-containing protein [Sulfurovum sp.]|jgi:hypothetical protein|uniref:DUF4395 domain-containing protein n=1 Tax=Sulfurovum sp. TaxID=1969726 RepID=UPI002A36183C|nr:DUF4395 domain-containing protein [Sulfurovum sp.]MDY0401816.1 DUF4395 domain-containing protein [Sulfurovum sp.]